MQTMQVKVIVLPNTDSQMVIFSMGYSNTRLLPLNGKLVWLTALKVDMSKWVGAAIDRHTLEICCISARAEWRMACGSRIRPTDSLEARSASPALMIRHGAPLETTTGRSDPALMYSACATCNAGSETDVWWSALQLATDLDGAPFDVGIMELTRPIFDSLCLRLWVFLLTHFSTAGDRSMGNLSNR
jgi:hypothetical protein